MWRTKRVLIALLVILFSVSSYAGPIRISRDLNPNIEYTLVEVIARSKPIRTYTIHREASGITIDVPYSSCVMYRAMNVNKDGTVSDPSTIKEFKVQKGKIVPCQAPPTTSVTTPKSAIQQ